MDFTIFAVLIIGIVVGSVAAVIVLSRTGGHPDVSREDLKDAFSSVSAEALKDFHTLAAESVKSQLEKGAATLEEKKKLIDSNLETVSKTLQELRNQSTALAAQLGENQIETGKLRATTEDLRNVLSSSQARGQWGEKMVKDILSMMGLVENFNYVSQQMVESGEKPDYTFFLPKEKSVNMDVKFPLAHYERFVASETEADQETEKNAFLRDVKGHIKDVAGRGYIDPKGGTVDYVLVFIPNESIYAFLHENDPEMLDFALSKRIILCSPITLYAVLSLIHQAVESFAMEQAAGKVVALLGEFEKQWNLYIGAMEKMGRRIDDVKKEYDALTSTRTRQLERSLTKIQDIKLGGDGEQGISESFSNKKDS
ncbi:MAG: recombinase RmuC [Candidatus Marinimicrobia bacterium]|nr:recombinase RmuC [Candidatus Neomarinimicrobiota bacterium]|tara:strand:+ start:23378 stop:24484 length:1107 start_codon:yes stop_codon:yes gene_type:complete